MARIHVPRKTPFPYHLTARTTNSEWFQLPMNQTWKIFEEQLFFLYHGFGFKIHAFVLMNNHYHLIASTPNLNLSEGMYWFQKEISRSVNQAAKRKNQVWGSRFFRSLIDNPRYFLHAYKYVYLNPVKAGIAATVEEYPFSTLQTLFGQRRSCITIFDNTIEDMSTECALDWLNTMPDEEDWQCVEKGLKRTHFRLAKCRKTKRPHRLETERF